MRNLFKFQTLFLLTVLGILIFYTTECNSPDADSIRVGVFEVNATPPIGSPVANAKTRSIVDSLYAKGIVILSDQKPVVLCSVDWVGIANEGQDLWRESLAKAAGTTIDRVSVHAIHQHDGCWCDLTTERILSKYSLGGWRQDTLFTQNTIKSVALAVRNAKQNAQSVTHLGFGEAKVEKVASNRRILGENGNVKIVRFSSTRDSAAIAAPEGLIDPWLKCVSFWQDDQPIAILNYYATHPMSHYGEGDVSSDFVGIARENRQLELGVPHIYFSGAGGNIAAGKYNDGSHERRFVLADRMERAMLQAWEETEKVPLSTSDLEWRNVETELPLRKVLVEEELIARLEDSQTDSLKKIVTARQLAWLQRTMAGYKTNISALKLANVWLLNLPGEPFVEYQLAAQKMRPGDHVCTSAYEDLGPTYLGTEIAYTQDKGYEQQLRVSFVSPEIENTLMTAMKQVLK